MCPFLQNLLCSAARSHILSYWNMKEATNISMLLTFLTGNESVPFNAPPHQPCSLYTTWWVLFHVSVVHEASMLEMEALCASFGSSLTEEDASSFDKNMEKDTRQQAKTHTRGHHTGSLPPSVFRKISTWVSVREILISPHFLPSVLRAVEHWAASGCRTSTRWQELSTWVF